MFDGNSAPYIYIIDTVYSTWSTTMQQYTHTPFQLKILHFWTGSARQVCYIGLFVHEHYLDNSTKVVISHMVPREGP
jgi:hypothetical protein